MTKPATYTSATLPWHVALWSTHVAYKTWRKTEESNPIPFLRTRYSKPVAGPSPLHHLPYLVPPVGFEPTYYTPLFERGDFAKFVHGGIYRNTLQSSLAGIGANRELPVVRDEPILPTTVGHPLGRTMCFYIWCPGRDLNSQNPAS